MPDSEIICVESNPINFSILTVICFQILFILIINIQCIINCNLFIMFIISRCDVTTDCCRNLKYVCVKQLLEQQE